MASDPAGAEAAPSAHGPGRSVRPTASGAHYPCFDGLRAIAALTVLLTHVSFLVGANTNHSLGAYFARMDVGVSIFFVISGFLLYRPFAAAHADGHAPPALGAFLRRRLLRILPAYWVALTLIVWVFRAAEINTLRDAVIYYGLLQIYDPVSFFGGISQAWSLCTEMSFYVFLPLYAWAVGRGGGNLRRELVGLALLYATSLVFRLGVLELGSSRSGIVVTWLPATLDLFALGMALAVGVVWCQRDGAGSKLHRLLGAQLAPSVSWALAGISFWTASRRLGLPLTLEPMSTFQSFGRQFLYGTTALFLVVPAVFGPQDQGFIRRLLANRAVQLAGLVSYGVYLWHKLWIEKAFEWLDLEEFAGGLPQVLAVTVVLSFVSAGLSYVLVERPALRFKHSRARSDPLHPVDRPAAG